MKIFREIGPVRRNNICKGPEAGMGLTGLVIRPLWPETRAMEQAGRRVDKSCRALWDAVRTLAFALREMGGVPGSEQRRGMT